MASFEFAAIALIEEIEKRDRMHMRVYRDPQDPFSLSDAAFVKKFRISKDIFSLLLEKLRPSLPFNGLPPHLRILVALRFYASGRLQKSVADDIFISLSQASVSRCIKTISKIMDDLLFNQYVTFPESKDEQYDIQEKFYDKTGFPGVVGIIGSTHITLKSNEAMSHTFMNGKGYNSLKLQVVVDSDLRILGMKSDSPGSHKDSSIWYQNEIRSTLLKQFSMPETPATWLLGDNNYPLEPWLLTPFVNIKDSQEIYNKKHNAACNYVNKFVRMFKSHYRCLSKYTSLHYSPDLVSNIVNSCAVLHNLCLKYKVPLHYVDNDRESDQDVDSNIDQTKSPVENIADLAAEEMTSLNNSVAESRRNKVLKVLLQN